ncbi:hypothetical protein ENBRE01_1625 [Enteropsectra breve]|nr:hypothetical protein ENBRE01_1625 [Enteropsectra breve]
MFGFSGERKEVPENNPAIEKFPLEPIVQESTQNNLDDIKATHKSFLGKMKERYLKIYKSAPSFKECLKLRGNSILLPEMSFYDIFHKNLVDFEVNWFLAMLIADTALLTIVFLVSRLRGFYCIPIFLVVTALNLLGIGNFKIRSFNVRLILVNSLLVLPLFIRFTINLMSRPSYPKREFVALVPFTLLHLIFIFAQLIHAAITTPIIKSIDI